MLRKNISSSLWHPAYVLGQQGWRAVQEWENEAWLHLCVFFLSATKKKLENISLYQKINELFINTDWWPVLYTLLVFPGTPLRGMPRDFELVHLCPLQSQSLPDWVVLRYLEHLSFSLVVVKKNVGSSGKFLSTSTNIYFMQFIIFLNGIQYMMATNLDGFFSPKEGITQICGVISLDNQMEPLYCT